jgi:hypothetical protein
MGKHLHNAAEAELARMKREMATIMYGSGHKITLDSGRILIMTSLMQRTTYSRTMKSLPTRKYNDSRVNYDHDSETYVLHAPRLYSNFCQMLPPDSSFAQRYAGDPVEVLPGITCIARMISNPCEPNDWTEYDAVRPVSSCLTLVWFQNYWAMPIAPEVMEKLKVFDWDAHACDKAVL